MKALILGVNGQDGSYLAEFLLDKGYEVIGVRRRSSGGSLWRLAGPLKHNKFTLVEGDITDFSSCLNLLDHYGPSEIYNLAAQSHVGTSFTQPGYTWDVTAKGCLNLLEALKFLNYGAKFYQASSSEMFGTSCNKLWCSLFDFSTGKTKDGRTKEQVSKEELDSQCYKFQNESTPFSPQSPYAIAKLAAHQSVKLYREAYGIYAVGGILFNHESPRRGVNFVTRKITSWFYNWTRGQKLDKLQLGNLDSCRDWGYAKEYVEGMWLMLQQSNPKDYVIGTGETHTVKEFLHEVVKYLYPKYNNGRVRGWERWVDLLVEVNDNNKRPAEVPYLRADASLANKELGWKPKTSFKELVKLMCDQENGKE